MQVVHSTDRPSQSITVAKAPVRGSITARIRTLLEHGLTSREVHDLTGIDYNTVRGTRARLMREGRLHAIHVMLPLQTAQDLAALAAARGTSRSQLCADLLLAAHRDGLVDAVLDRGPAQDQPQ